MILDNLKIDPGRFSVEWVSAAEGVRFVKVITEFDSRIADLGTFGQKEGIDFQTFQYKLKAAIMALEGRTLRMTFAKQARQILGDGTYGQFPSRAKLLDTFGREKTLYETLLYLQQKERTVPELAGLLAIPDEEVMTFVETLKKKNMLKEEINK